MIQKSLSVLFAVVIMVGILGSAHWWGGRLNAATDASADISVGPIWKPLYVEKIADIEVGDFAMLAINTATEVTVGITSTGTATLGAVNAATTSVHSTEVGDPLEASDLTVGSFKVEGQPDTLIQLTFTVADTDSNDGITFAVKQLRLADASASNFRDEAKTQNQKSILDISVKSNALVDNTTNNTAFIELAASTETANVYFGGVFSLTAGATYPKTSTTIATVMLTASFP